MNFYYCHSTASKSYFKQDMPTLKGQALKFQKKECKFMMIDFLHRRKNSSRYS